MSTVNVSIIFHFHQPVDNFGWVNEEAYEMSYNPLITSIENSNIKVHLHFTGPLLEWLEENRKEFLERVVRLVKKGQVSIVGGGYSEPILSMIPEEFRKIQIHKLRDWWKNKFNIDVNGCWIAERVWEPGLAKSLNEAGVDYIFLDDLYIKSTGKSELETFYTYFTEDQGKGVTIVPINEPIRYLIPWKPAENTIEYLKKGITIDNDSLILIMSDAEKMGLWSAGKRTTHDICYETGWNEDKEPWMDRVFRLIGENKKINSILIPNYLKSYQSRGLIYIPSASYDKMGVWVLPTEDRRKLEELQQLAKEGKIDKSDSILRFAKGSFWRNFLVKYQEVNIIHKRMIRSVERVLSYNLLNNEDIIDEIIAAQSNDAYWHGMFGGSYYRFMRHSLNKHAARAGGLIDQLHPPKRIQITDHLKNGRDEIIYTNNNLLIMISPFEGGTVFTLENKANNYNWSNSFTRYRESYSKPEYPVDRWIRRSLRDHFTNNINLDSLVNDKYKELSNLSDRRYEIKKSDNLVTLESFGTLLGSIVTIKKSFEIKDNRLTISYNIIGDKLEDHIFFIPELNFTLNTHPHMTSMRLNDKENQEFINSKFKDKISQIKLIDNYEKSTLTINLENTIETAYYPVITYSETTVGSEEQFQGSCILPIYKYDGELNFKIELILDN